MGARYGWAAEVVGFDAASAEVLAVASSTTASITAGTTEHRNTDGTGMVRARLAIGLLPDGPTARQPGVVSRVPDACTGCFWCLGIVNGGVDVFSSSS